MNAVTSTPLGGDEGVRNWVKFTVGVFVKEFQLFSGSETWQKLKKCMKKNDYLESDK